MKKLLLSLALTLIFISCNEKSTIEPIVNIEKDVSLKTDYDLPEITITGYRDLTNSSALQDIYTLYVGADYHVSSNPYTAFTEEYAGQNIDIIPGIKTKVIQFLNQQLQKINQPQFSDKEVTFLSTLKVRQIFQVYSVMLKVVTIGVIARNTTFSGEPIDGGYSNAFMHVFMANKMSQALGLNLGTQFMNLHEAGQVGNNTQMDNLNNQLGVDRFKANDFMNYLVLYNLARDGQLWTIDPVTNVLGRYKFMPKKGIESYQD